MRPPHRLPDHVITRIFIAAVFACGPAIPQQLLAQSSPTSSPARSAGRSEKPATNTEPEIDPGSLTNSLYRNKTLGFTCKIPAGWVLRTDEMNAPPDNQENQHQPATAGEETASKPQASSEALNPKDKPSSSQSTGRVLLAAFSRPPEAHGQEVNSSIVIAAEPVATYPGLRDATQYFGPLIEVAQAQGFTMDEDLYEIAIGTKTLVRGDFHKDVGTRVLRQSTLALLSHGYAVSFTVIAGTDDDVEELIDGLDFQGASRVGPPPK